MSRHVYDIVKKYGEEKNFDVSYTPDDIVEQLIKTIPIDKNDIVIDAGSGINKVWYNHLPDCNKIELEIEDGYDFLLHNERADWIIGNPPYSLIIDFIFKSAQIANKGFCFLINHNRWNSLTPARLHKLEKQGFYLSNIIILSIKKWFGRYYFVKFTKNKSDNISFIH